MIEKQKKENDLIELIVQHLIGQSQMLLGPNFSRSRRRLKPEHCTPMIASMPSSSANGF
jgi:hypothetical protein